MNTLTKRLDRMRMALGLFIVLDSHPIGFFFKETLGVPMDTAVFTASFLSLGFILMIPSTFFKILYLPNVPIFYALMAFLVTCIIYAFLFNEVALAERNKDMIYYAFVVAYMLLLILIPNDIAREVAFVGVIFTLITNLALIYALAIDPDWHIGQRAAIQFGPPGERSGNPHVFARNAQIGIICSLLWAYRPNQNMLIKVLGIAMAIFNVAIIILTFSKAAILATTMATFIYLLANIHRFSPQKILLLLTSPITLFIASLPFIVLFTFISLRPDIWEILVAYSSMIYDRFSENILALLGLESGNTGYVAELDVSSANRALSWQYTVSVLKDNPTQLFIGFGYKYMFMDLPILEALINQGIVPFLIYAYIFYTLWKQCLSVAYRGGQNDLESLFTYCFFMFFASYLFAGRPYEIAVFHPLCLFVRFINIYYPPELAWGYNNYSEPVQDRSFVKEGT